MKNARRKLEIPMPAEMPCKLQGEKYREPAALKRSARQNTLVLLRPMNLRGSAWKDFLTSVLKIILLNHYNLVHKFIPMPQAMKMRRQQWTRNGKSSKRFQLPSRPQIRIRFSSLRFFFERFEFLVCSKFNHMQRDCTCACAVACLHPHNCISNVVVSLMILDNIFFYTLIADIF